MKQAQSKIDKHVQLDSRLIGFVFCTLSVIGLLAVLAYGIVSFYGLNYSYVGETDGEKIQRYFNSAAFYCFYIFPMIGIAIWNIRDSFLMIRNSNFGRLRILLVKSGVGILMTIVLFSIIRQVDSF